MKYPYIGEYMGNVTLFTGKDSGVSIVNSGFGQGRYSEGWGEIGFTNITHKYLANTYGEVVSPEHAEFIFELAENAGFELARQSKHHGKFFSFDVKGFCFLDTEIIASQHCKKITIPPPPEPQVKKWGPYFYDLGELPRHFDCVCNKCGGKCCTGQCDKQELSEWPQIGDEVTWGEREIIGILKCVVNGRAWILCPNGRHTQQGVKYLKPPKTPEEELRDGLSSIINDLINMDASNNAFVDMLMDK